MQFADPLALWLLLLVPPYLWLRWPRPRRAPRARLGLATLGLLDRGPAGVRARWANVPVVLRAGTLALVVVGLARPRSEGEVRDERLRGRNIVLALDLSSSMKALDFQPGNRLDVSKHVLEDFVRQRSGDFMGLVVFASRAFTQAPLTTDRAVLLDLLDRVDIGMLPDGTAIGTALAMSADQLKDLRRGSGVIILVTDGGNNTGSPDPLTAAAVARTLGIRIYAIGVSSRSAAATPAAMTHPATMEAPVPLSDRDEALLRRIATVSGGQYYRATDGEMLTKTMQGIDRLEKTEMRLREVRSYHEHFPALVVPAVVLLALELVLGATWLRRLP